MRLTQRSILHAISLEPPGLLFKAVKVATSGARNLLLQVFRIQHCIDVTIALAVTFYGPIRGR